MTEIIRAEDDFSGDERRALEPYFTNLDRPVFALRNLPEVVKAALFARYSRSPKSLRRLFLDEFLDQVPVGAGAESAVGIARSEQLFQRVLAEYGDDSVAQLGGAHVAVEGASNLLTKVLEWGRLMAYLEQSTRYIPYTAQGRRALALRRAGGGGGHRARRRLRALPRRGVRHLRRLDRHRDELLRRASTARRGGRRRRRYKATVRAKALDSAARAAAGGDAVERRHLRAAARPTSSCSCACAPIRWRRRAPAPRRCSPSCAR